MRKADFDEFCELLDAVCGLLSRGSYTPSAANSALWFRALQEHSLDVVRAAFDAHVKDPQRGRFVPTPADVIAQIAGFADADGRPGPEEAWAMSVLARDESETVVWTAEMAAAWGISLSVLDLGDDVGARMAFKEAYARLVDEARRCRTPVSWSASLGHDASRRSLAVGSAVALGRLPASDLDALPAPRGMLLLESEQSGIPEHIQEKMRELRELLTVPRPAGPSRDVLAKKETAAKKASVAQAVRAYADHPGAGA